MLLGVVSTVQVIDAEWTPTKLFRNETTGFWYDPSSFNNINQTSSITTAVTNFEQNVGAVFDFSTLKQPSSFLNTLYWSEDFSQAVWTKNRIGVTTGAIAGPFPATTADEIETIAGGASASYIYQGTTRASGTIYTFSVYVKAGNVNRVALNNSNGLAGAAQGIFDLSTGTWVNGGATGAAEDVGGGWYRLSQTSTITSNGTGNSFVGPINNTGTLITGITTGNYVYVYGAQTQTGSTATNYIKTTDTLWSGLTNPALQSTSGSRPVIRARYNILERTEEFNESYWGKSGSSIGTNAEVAPDGTTTADSLIENSSTSVHNMFRNTILSTFVSSKSYYYRFSIYAKASSRTAFYIYPYDNNNATSWAAACFDLTTGTVSKTGQGTGNTVILIASDIINVGSGWYKVYIDVQGNVTGVALALSNTTNPTFNDANFGQYSYAGNGTGRIFFWGYDVRPNVSFPNLPDYQKIVTATNYVNSSFNSAVLFPQGINFDGSDDFFTVENVGGASSAFLFAAGVQLTSIGNDKEILFSDLNGNNGIEIYITLFGELALTVGNGTSLTTITTTTFCSLFGRHVVMAWYDGVNIYVQIDDAPATFTAFSSLSPGTTTATIGKVNGVSSSYYNGWMYAMLYNKNLVPTLEDINGSLAYCQQSNLSPLDADDIGSANVTQLPVYAMIQQDPQVAVTQLPVYTITQQDPQVAVTQLPVYINTKVDKRLYLTQAPIYVISIL